MVGTHWTVNNFSCSLLDAGDTKINVIGSLFWRNSQDTFVIWWENSTVSPTWHTDVWLSQPQNSTTAWGPWSCQSWIFHVVNLGTRHCTRLPGSEKDTQSLSWTSLTNACSTPRIKCFLTSQPWHTLFLGLCLQCMFCFVFAFYGCSCSICRFPC